MGTDGDLVTVPVEEARVCVVSHTHGRSPCGEPADPS